MVARRRETAHARGTAVPAVDGLLGLSMAVQLVVAMPVRCSAHVRSPMHMDGMHDLCGRPMASCGVHIYVILKIAKVRAT